VRPSDNVPQDYVAEENIIGGNVILFGATSGRYSCAEWSASDSPFETPALTLWSKALVITDANT